MNHRDNVALLTLLVFRAGCSEKRTGHLADMLQHGSTVAQSMQAIRDFLSDDKYASTTKATNKSIENYITQNYKRVAEINGGTKVSLCCHLSLSIISTSSRQRPYGQVVVSIFEPLNQLTLCCCCLSRFLVFRTLCV